MALRDWLKRNIDGRSVEDSHQINNIEYNSMSGAQKNIEVGPALKYKSVLTAEVKLCAGDQLYIFNTSGAIEYVRMGDLGVAAPAAAPEADNFPVLPGQFTVYSAADYNYIRGSANLHLYVLRDESRARANKTDR